MGTSAWEGGGGGTLLRSKHRPRVSGPAPTFPQALGLAQPWANALTVSSTTASVDTSQHVGKDTRAAGIHKRGQRVRLPHT